MADSGKPWLKHYDPQVKPNLEYESIPLYEFLRRTAEKTPERTAVIFRNYKLNYAELDRISGIMAANLRAHGLQPGDRVSIMLPNLPQTIISYWAVLKAGGVVVMTNPLYMENELMHQTRDANVSFMIVLDLLWPKISSLFSALGLKKVFVTGVGDALCFPLNYLYKLKLIKQKKKVSVPYNNIRIFPWKPLVRGRTTFVYEGVDSGKDLAMLQYTGGTTGISKGVELTHLNISANVRQCESILHSLGQGAEIFLGILPYFHIYGLTTSMIFPTLLGATLIPFPSFSPREVLEACKKYKPTVFPSAPSIFMAMLQQKDVASYDMSSIRCCISGSAPLPMETIMQFKKLANAEIVEGYGLTEASPVTHLNPLVGTKKNGSIGLPFPDTEARIVDLELGTVPMPVGKIGELIVRGPQVMKGYHNRPDETASTIRNGWLYTGDIAYMDEDGYFFIVDRKKDLIISGGYNIYPREVDEVLHQHPKVKEGVAVGIPHPTRGEVVKAYVVPKDGVTVSKEEILSFCRRKLANYKVPKQVEFRKELPKTMVGKVLRRALRKEEMDKKSANRNGSK